MLPTIVEYGFASYTPGTVLLNLNTALDLSTRPHTYPLPLQFVVDSLRVRRRERTYLLLRARLCTMLQTNF
jgi:uncharacterized ferritin-like protein (DUF455 family)